MKKLKVYIGLIAMLCLISITDIKAQKNFYVSLSGYKEISSSSILYTYDGGVTFDIGNYISAGAGINACKFWNNDYSSLGLGVGPVLQIYALKKTKYKLFLEGKGDVMYMFPEYPSTAINFAGYWGVFTEYNINKENGLRLGLCYNHFSNGRTLGWGTNPCWDAFGFNIGWTFH